MLEERYLRNFLSYNWARLDADERRETLQQLEYYNAAQMGRPARTISIDKMADSSTNGYYSQMDPSRLHINEDNLLSDDPKKSYELMRTVSHEGRHGYQDDCVRGRIANNEDAKTIEDWRDNLQGGYLSVSDGSTDIQEYIDYRYQSIEADANDYGNSVLKANEDYFKDDPAYQEVMNRTEANDRYNEAMARHFYGDDYKETIQEKSRQKYEAVQNGYVSETDPAVTKELQTNAQYAYRDQGSDTYPGRDAIENGVIREGSHEHLYQASYYKDPESGRMTSYFTDRATLDGCMQDGVVDSNKLADKLQTGPSTWAGHEGEHRGYVNEYSVDWDRLGSLKQEDPDFYSRVTDTEGNLRMGFGTTEANTQYGEGGGNQYINQDVKDLCDRGVLKYEGCWSEEDGTLQRRTESREEMEARDEERERVRDEAADKEPLSDEQINDQKATAGENPYITESENSEKQLDEQSSDGEKESTAQDEREEGLQEDVQQTEEADSKTEDETAENDESDDLNETDGEDLDDLDEDQKDSAEEDSQDPTEDQEDMMEEGEDLDDTVDRSADEGKQDAQGPEEGEDLDETLDQSTEEDEQDVQGIEEGEDLDETQDQSAEEGMEDLDEGNEDQEADDLNESAEQTEEEGQDLDDLSSEEDLDDLNSEEDHEDAYAEGEDLDDTAEDDPGDQAETDSYDEQDEDLQESDDLDDTVRQDDTQDTSDESSEQSSDLDDTAGESQESSSDSGTGDSSEENENSY